MPFFFIVAGTKRRVEREDETAPRVRFCPRCGGQRRFYPARERLYLTVFFFPLLPLGSGRQCLACESCQLCVPESVPYREPGTPGDGIFCPHCGRPIGDNEAVGWGRITCPLCGGRFRLE